MSVQIAVKNIEYAFDDSSTFQLVKGIAEQTVRELYQDEQSFQREEFETMCADGEVSNYAEYCDAVGIRPSDVDYRKPFSDNIAHPHIQKKLSELQKKYMCNVFDLPKNAVITISDFALDSKGNPDNAAIYSALKEKLGVVASVSGFETADKAEKRDIVSQSAYEKIGEMIKSNDFKSYLDLKASIGKYSSKNISLIYDQMPSAKVVMGCHAWHKLDRHVCAGQKGISIWCPCKCELKNEKQVDNYIEKHRYSIEADGYDVEETKEEIMKEIEKKGVKEVCIGFSLGTVFDICQTAPNNRMYDIAMDIVNLNKPLFQDLENYDEIVRCMKDAATLAPLNITHGLSQQDALFDAVANYADKLLTNTPDKVKGIKSSVPFIGDMHTIETLMSAYLICTHIGIECADKVCFKLAAIFNNKELTEQSVKFGKREMFLKSFDRACCVSDQFNKAFDKSFGCDLEAQREAIVKQVEERREREEAERKAKALNRVYFGKTPMQKQDVWIKNGEKYIIAQNEENNAFYVKVILDTKHISFKYLKNDEGKAKRFDTPPSRETVEKLFEQQMVEKSGDSKNKSKQTDCREV